MLEIGSIITDKLTSRKKKDIKSDYLLMKLRFSRGKLKGKVSFLVTVPLSLPFISTTDL